MKRIKIIRVLATYICHDPFAYSHKGYLTLIYDEKIAFILNVEKLPSKEKLIEESRNIK